MLQNRNKKFSVFYSLSSQNGAALIMALLVIAIVAAISTTIMLSQQIGIAQMIVQESADQAYLNSYYVPPAINFQVKQLIKQRLQQKILPVWPQIMPSKRTVDGTQINATWLPAAARFNINNLAQPISQYLTVFSDLIQIVEPKITKKKAQQIAIDTQKWLLPIKTNQQDINPYATMSPPYQAAHQQMVSSSELRLVKGVSAELYQRLQPYIIALPSTDIPIDINAAPKQILMALLNRDETAANAVLAYRKDRGGFANNGLFLNLRQVKFYAQQKGSDLNKLISSKMPTYYLARIEVKKDKLSFHWVAILKFASETKTIQVIREAKSL